MTPPSDKPIRFIRLAVCTDCNLGCGYCFVRKDGRRMTFATARKAVDLLLPAPGRDKTMTIYGGEPLLHFPLVRKTVLYARRKAAALGKDLTLSLGTNGTLLEKKHLDFLRAHRVKLLVSLDGAKAVHDRYRTAPGGTGSYEGAARALRLALARLPAEDVSAQLVVLPATAGELSRSLGHIYGLGVDNVYIQIAFSPRHRWRPAQVKTFSKGLPGVHEGLRRRLEAGRPVFLNTVNMELKGEGTSTHEGGCPFCSCLEIYPDGGFAFSPFLQNLADRGRYLAGDVRRGPSGKYRACRYSPRSAACAACWKDYLGGALDFPGALAALEACNAAARRLAREITAKAAKSAAYRRYIKEAKRRIYQ